jgi:ribulose 1,5-bisphosphate carboxylase large subunit-like protein
MPFGPEQGAAHIRSALAVVNGLPLDEAAREAIFHTNSEKAIGARKP